MIERWDDLEFWSSPEWTKIQETLDELDRQGIPYNPDRSLIFRALDECPLDKCRVAIFGQDPYPQAKFATGLAFSIPPSESKWPVTLTEIISEYVRDVLTRSGYGPRFPTPFNGDLTKWAHRGVLLWNVIPTCLAGSPLSHYELPWNILTEEIISTLATRPQGFVFVFLGKYAREFVRVANEEISLGLIKDKDYEAYSEGNNFVIEAAHPAAIRFPRHNEHEPNELFYPFQGSRIFTLINYYLVQHIHQDPIDWRL